MAGNLFSQRGSSAREGVKVIPKHMVVEPCTYRGREMWAVRWYDMPEPVRRYDSEVAAWDHACRVPFHLANTLPKISQGDMFEIEGKGYVSDPRWAIHVPADSVDDETRKRIDAATVRYIRHQLKGEVADDEAFHAIEEHNTPEQARELTRAHIARAYDLPPEIVGMRDDECRDLIEPAETPLETPDNPSESLSGDGRATTPPEESEAVESDSEAEQWETAFWEDHASDYADDPGYRRAFNFLDLAENAPSPQARAYWLEKWEELG